VAVLLEEIQYQDQVALAGQINAQAMSLPVLAQIIAGAVAGGDSNALSDSLHSLSDFARDLLVGEKRKSDDETSQESRTEEILRSHPAVLQFYKWRDETDYGLAELLEEEVISA